MSDLHDQIKAAIDGMDLPKARELLREAMPNADAETFYLASRVALDDEQKQDFLKQAIQLDPFHEKAHAALKGAATVATPPPPAPSIPTTAVPQTPVAQSVTPSYDPSEIERIFIEKHYQVVVTADADNQAVKQAVAEADTYKTETFVIFLESILGNISNNVEAKAVKFPHTIKFGNDRLRAQQFIQKVEPLGAFTEYSEYDDKINLQTISAPDGADTDAIDLICRFSAVGGFIIVLLLVLYGVYSLFTLQFAGLVVAFIAGSVTFYSSVATLEIINKRALKRGYYKSKGL